MGKLADLVLWKPSLFGAKPEMVIKGGTIAWAQMGDPNASVPTPEPVMMRPMFGALGQQAGRASLLLVRGEHVQCNVSFLAYGCKMLTATVKS